MPEPGSTSPFESYRDRWVERLLRDDELKAGVIELVEAASHDAGLTARSPPAAFRRLLDGPRLQQQLRGLGLAVLRDLGFKA